MTPLDCGFFYARRRSRCATALVEGVPFFSFCLISPYFPFFACCLLLCEVEGLRWQALLMGHLMVQSGMTFSLPFCFFFPSRYGCEF